MQTSFITLGRHNTQQQQQHQQQNTHTHKHGISYIIAFSTVAVTGCPDGCRLSKQ
jgi:hypothetical protein